MNLNKIKEMLKYRMYDDTMIVIRQMPIIDEDGADTYSLDIVGESDFCHLSQSQKSSLNITDSIAKYEQNMKVFTTPDIEILPNDILEVEHEGQKYKLRASLPFKYSTHQEIPVKLESDA